MTQTALNQHPWPKGPRKGWIPNGLDVEQLRHRFGPAESDAIKELMAAIRQAETPLFTVKPEQFRDPVLDRFMLPLVDELKHGPGLVFLSDLAQLGPHLDDWRLAYWGIGTYFGDQVSQSVRGEMMADVKVRDIDSGERVYTSPLPVGLHSDRIDIVSLLCVQPAMKGGTNGFASSLAIRDIVAHERPDLMPWFERGFRQSRGNEQQAGDDPITPYHVPVFAEKDGLMSCLFSSNASLTYQHDSVKADLSPREIEALQYLEAVCARPEIRTTILFQRGDAVFINNYEVLHARDAFEDSPDPAKKRHLLRMWIAGRPPRPRVAEQTVIVNSSGLQGIDPQPDKVAADGSIMAAR